MRIPLLLCGIAQGTLGVSAAIGAEPAAVAAPADRHDYALPAQPLGAALRAVALTSGRGIVVSSTLVEQKQAPPLNGSFSTEQAVAALLAGTGLRATAVGNSMVITADEPSTQHVDSTLGNDIVVTGTRIRGAAPAGSNVITIDRESIEHSGYATTQQILQALPQNFGGGPNEGTAGFSVRNNANGNFGFGSSANLRGLGTSSTLVLVDSNRLALGGAGGTFVDLSLIPSSAIARIEVLADGASALYGSDAVAGVVNVRLRNDYTGFETRARYGRGRGFNEWQASQLAGIAWSTGHLVLAYEFYRRDAVPAAGRPYVTEDLRPFGGPDYRRSYANPGTITAADGRIFGIPGGQDGRGLVAGDLLPGQPNLGDARAGTDVVPAIQRHAALASFEQALGSTFKLRAEVFAADRRTVRRANPDNSQAVVVPPSNPFYVDPIGTGQPITVNYDFSRDFGPQIERAHVRTASGVAELSASLGRWSAAATGSYSVQTERDRIENLPNYFNLAAALADPDLRTAFNVLGDGSFTNPATIDRVRGYYLQAGRSRLWSSTLKFEGPLFTLPAGPVRLALGTEYRHEHYTASGSAFQSGPAPIDLGNGGFPPARSIIAGYSELYVPLTAPEMAIAGLYSLDLSAAARVEHYSDFGTTTNPKVGISWRPFAGLTLRGTYGTSFRAPSFTDFRQGRGTSLFIPLPVADPGSQIGTTTALALFGNLPGIGPERARTWTAGLDLRPLALPQLHASLTYFDIHYRDRIATPGSDYQTFLADRARYQSLITDAPSAALIAGYYGDVNFSNPFGIAPSAIAVILDGRTRNLSSVRQTGLDFDIGYTASYPRGAIEVGVSGAYLFRIDQRLTPTAPATDVVSTLGNPVDLRLRGRISATRDRFSLAAFVNIVDGYRNTVVAPVEPVANYTTVDLQFGYDLTKSAGALRGLRLSLSVSNLFDRDPPYVNNSTGYSAAGFDPENASATGRVVALQVTKEW